MQAKAFSHIYLPSRSVDESIVFYTERLGFKLLRKYAMGSGASASAYCELGGVLLELTQGQNTPDTDGRTEPRIGLQVDDIAESIAELKAAGVHVEREPWTARTFWGLQAMIKDPSGWIISLREWKEPDGPYYADWQPVHDDVQAPGVGDSPILTFPLRGKGGLRRTCHPTAQRPSPRGNDDLYLRIRP